MTYLTIRGQRMFYEDRGSGFPLIFGHSYLWNSAMWQPQVDALSAHYRCIVPDLWGHGRSDSPPESSYTIEGLAEDYWTLADSLGLERFAIVGLSVGGMWGTHLTLNHPEAVAASVLMDTFVGPEPEQTRALYFGMLDAVEQMGEFEENLAATVAPIFFSPKTAKSSPEMVNRFKSDLMAEPAERIPGVVGIGRGIFGRNSVLERLSEIEAPTMVVVGADDQPRPPHEAQAMAERIRGARLVIIDDAGHICNLEQPARVTELLSTFLADAL